jgi:hypothetical protein
MDTALGGRAMTKSPRQPRWDESDAGRVRVLLECSPSGSPSIIASAIERRGYAVSICEGPSVKPCELLENGACALVDGADVVVNMLGTTASEIPVLPAVAGLRRYPAILAEVRQTDHPAPGVEHATPTSGSAEVVVELRPPITTHELFGGIEEALRRRERRVAWWGDGFC